MFGVDLFDAALLPSLAIALLAGGLSFLSPCVLPVVPPYLAYMSGLSIAEMRAEGRRRTRWRLLLPALFFVLGLSTIFIVLGATASALAGFVLQNKSLLAKLSGGIVILFGLHFLGVFRIPLLDREARLAPSERLGGSALGAYVLGLVFAFGWTPCIGPQLGAILSLAGQESSVARGAFLLAFYAIGLGVPFLLCAVFIERASGLLQRLKPWMGAIERAMGGLLLLVGILLFFESFSEIGFWLLELS